MCALRMESSFCVVPSVNERSLVKGCSKRFTPLIEQPVIAPENGGRLSLRPADDLRAAQQIEMRSQNTSERNQARKFVRA